MTAVSPQNISSTTLRTLFCIAVFGVLSAWVFITYTSFLNPFPFGYGEGPILDQAVRLANLESIYRKDIQNPPYTISNYPPVYPAFQAIFIAIFGPDFRIGRFISLVAILWAGFMVFSITVRLTQKKSAGYIATLLFLSNPMIIIWGRLGRVDSLALAFFLSGVSLLLSREKKFLLKASLLFTLAIYTRQTFLFASLFIPAAYFLFQKKWIELRKFLTIISCFLGIPALLLMLISDGGFFFHTITANTNSMLFIRFLYALIHLVGEISPLYIPIMLFFFVKIFDKRIPGALFISLLFISSLPAFLAYAKIGSAWNYLFEFLAAGSIAIGCLVAFFSTEKKFSSFLVFVSLSQVLYHLLWIGDFLLAEEQQRPDSIQRAKLESLLENIESNKKPVLGDAFLGIQSLAGDRLYYQPFIMTRLSIEKLWNPEDFIQQIQTQKFSFILIDLNWVFSKFSDRWTLEMLEAMDQAYSLQEITGNMAILHPEK